MEWQPIETAPKDGTSILVFPDIKVTNWGYTRDKQNEFGWIGCYSYTTDEYDTLDPTHWMPLPAPPTT